MVDITDAQVEAYWREGYLVIEQLAEPEDLVVIGGVFDRLFADKQGTFPGGYFDLARPYDSDGEDHLPQVIMPERGSPELHRTTVHARAAAVAARLLAVPVDELHAWSHMIDKPAGHGHETPWHQDEAYWDPGSSYHAVGAWVPLDDVDLENGCMCFIPGSHHGEVREHRHIDDDPAVHGLVVTSDVDASGMVPAPLKAGGATFHHPRMLHHTPPNRSARRRRAYATEYQTAPARTERVEDRPWIAAGKAAWDARTVYQQAPT